MCTNKIMNLSETNATTKVSSNAVTRRRYIPNGGKYPFLALARAVTGTELRRSRPPHPLCSCSHFERVLCTHSLTHSLTVIEIQNRNDSIFPGANHLRVTASPILHPPPQSQPFNHLVAQNTFPRFHNRTLCTRP